MNNSEIVVSVICTAYNHEKYIRQCLEGFISQKANFAFEVLINDDASTDNTAKIIREYEEKYPEIIKPVYQTENQYSKKVKISSTILFPKAKGKYIAFCEGDDYWTDPYKLQKQVNAFEERGNCHFCVHGIEIIEENGRSTGRYYPKVKVLAGVLTSRQFLDIIKTYNFQTSSYMVRSEDLAELYKNPPQFRKVADVGDEPMLLYFGSLGDVFFIADNMSRYRLNSVSSWNRNHRAKKENAIRHCNCMIKMLEEFDIYSHLIYHDICEKRILIQEFQKEYIQGNYKILLQKKYRDIYKKQSKKIKFNIKMHVLFPTIYSKFLIWYRKRKQRKNH